MDFVRSIPLLEVSPDFTWVEELVESLGSTSDEAYEQILRGDIEPVYQPTWTQHPTYQEMQNQAAAHPFLQSLESYIEAVNDCAADSLELLRKVHADLETNGPLEVKGKDQWRFVLTIGQGTIGWFRGTYLGQPSAREYEIRPIEDSEGHLASLYGVEGLPSGVQ